MSRKRSLANEDVGPMPEITIREVAKGQYYATYVDPKQPWVTYCLTTFDKSRIHKTIQKMIKQRREREENARESLR